MISRKIIRHFLRAKFFMFILIISNRTVYFVQFGINLHFWVFQKAPSRKLIPNWTRKLMIAHTNCTQLGPITISNHFKFFPLKSPITNIDYNHLSKPIQETIFVKLWSCPWWLFWKKLSHFASCSLYSVLIFFFFFEYLFNCSLTYRTHI